MFLFHVKILLLVWISYTVIFPYDFMLNLVLTVLLQTNLIFELIVYFYFLTMRVWLRKVFYNFCQQFCIEFLITAGNDLKLNIHQ